MTRARIHPSPRRASCHAKEACLLHSRQAAVLPAASGRPPSSVESPALPSRKVTAALHLRARVFLSTMSSLVWPVKLVKVQANLRSATIRSWVLPNPVEDQRKAVASLLRGEVVYGVRYKAKTSGQVKLRSPSIVNFEFHAIIICNSLSLLQTCSLHQT